MFKSLNTRNRIMILTTILSIAYVVVQEIDFRVLLDLNLNFDPVSPLILAILIYLGTFWTLFFKVRGERFITVLLFPAISVFALSLLAELITASVFSNVGQFGIVFMSAIIHWVFIYVTLLTVNILNTAYLEDIPLGQAARAAQFVLILVIGYVYFFILFSNDIFILFRLGGLAMISFLLMYIALWSIKLKISQRLIASANIALFILLAAAVLSIWPVTAPYIALVLSLILYINLGISLEIREIISKWIMIEYISLFFLIVIMLILVAEWGINGVII